MGCPRIALDLTLSDVNALRGADRDAFLEERKRAWWGAYHFALPLARRFVRGPVARKFEPHDLAIEGTVAFALSLERQPEPFKTLAHLEGFCSCVIHHRWIDMVRHEGRRPAGLAGRGAGETDTGPSPLESLVHQEWAQRALGRLNERQLGLLKGLLEGRSYAELAVAYGVNPGTISRWVAKLRARIKDQSGLEEK